MAQAIADVYKANMETVRDKIPALVEAGSYASQRIKRATEKHHISRTPNSADFRAPIKYQIPSGFGQFDSAGGVLVAGNGFKIEHLVTTCKEIKLGVDINLKTRWGSAANSKIKDAVKENMKDAMKAFRFFEDALWHNITGTQGFLAVATGLSTATYTLDTNFGANLLLRGQPVEVYDNDLTHRTTSVTPSNLPYISYIDKDNRVITLSNVDGLTLSDDDYIAIQGAGGTPASMNGLYAVNTTTVSGNLFGAAKTTYPELNSNFISGASGLTPDMVFKILAKIDQKIDDESGSLVGFAHNAQLHNIFNAGFQLSEWNRGKSDKMIDLYPFKPGDGVTLGGVKIERDKHSSRSRIDFVNMSDWVRVYEKEPDYYEDLQGNRFFHGRSSDSLTATDQFFIVASYNFMNAAPLRSGFIYGLPINLDS